LRRTDALHELIDRVESAPTTYPPHWLVECAGVNTQWLAWTIENGDLNAVSWIEAPLRDRGWLGPSIVPLPIGGFRVWHSRPGIPMAQIPQAAVATEHTSRLLAALKALLWEDESNHAATALSGSPNLRPRDGGKYE